MKKIFWLITVVMMTMMLALSCNKPDNGGKDTDPEPDPEPTEYADYIFEYSVVLPADATNYSYVELDLASVKCDGKNVWECFDLASQEELIAALGELASGAQSGQTVNFIGFDVSTEYVVETPSTTNAYGHWHTLAGDCCSWGDDAYLFAESGFEENLIMNIGQFPGRLVEGETYKIIEGMQNDDVVVAFEITVSVEAQNTWTAVANLTVEGDEVEAEFDVNAVASYFGYDLAGLVSALQAGTVKMMPTNADGSYYLNADGTPNYSQVDGEDAKGVFYNVDGNCCGWYNESEDYYGHFFGTMYYGVYESSPYLAFCITPYAATEEHIGSYAFLMDLTNGEKTVHLIYYVTLESAVPWAEYTEAEGFVYNIRMLVENNYKGLIIDIDDDAMKAALGVEDLAAAISAEEPTVIVWGLNADGSEATNEDGSRWNSGEGPFGHWFNAAGDVCIWGEEGVTTMCFNVKADDGVYVKTCQFPETSVVGNTYVMKQKFVAGDKSQIVTYNVSIVEEL